MLDAKELAQIRADFAGVLPDTCNILVVTVAPDGYGGVISTWGTATYNLPCRKDYTRGVKILSADGLVPFTGWTFTLPHDAACTVDNRIEHGGQTYAVKGQDAGKSWSACLRVAAEEL